MLHPRVRAWLVTALALVAGGCGGSKHHRDYSAKIIGVPPAGIAIAPPKSLSGPATAAFVAGRTVAARAGCLDCHTIGTQGNSGPGPNLTHVGRFLGPTALAAILRSPTPPMPSFQALPRRQLDDLVQFLEQLR
jgi:ubiquinol-cytochrome c reductase cytochrome b subunit/menaquinol-cytochrome c reductase cytochrome b/c subunit